MLGTRVFSNTWCFLAPIFYIFYYVNRTEKDFKIYWTFLKLSFWQRLFPWLLLQGLEGTIKYERPTKWSDQKYLVSNYQANRWQIMNFHVFFLPRESPQTKFFLYAVSKHYHPVALRILEAAQWGQLYFRKPKVVMQNSKMGSKYSFLLT